MKEWNPADNIRDDLIEMIWNVKYHYDRTTKHKVASICDDSTKIMSLIQSYKEEKISGENLLQQVGQIINSMDESAEAKSNIELINNHLIKIINSDIKKIDVNTDFWDYYVSYC